MSNIAVRKPEHRLRQILELTKAQWDTPAERDAVRANFRRVCACRTPALGGEVFASGAEEKVFYHTCRIKVLPELWQSRYATLAKRAVGHTT